LQTAGKLEDLFSEAETSDREAAERLHQQALKWLSDLRSEFGLTAIKM
jgi:hypothetical protein